MLERQIREDNETLDLPISILSKQVPSVHHVAPGGDVGDMDLLFAACQPALNAVIGLRNEIRRNFLPFIELLDTHILFVCMTNISCNLVIM